MIWLHVPQMFRHPDAEHIRADLKYMFGSSLLMVKDWYVAILFSAL